MGFPADLVVKDDKNLRVHVVQHSGEEFFPRGDF